MTFKTASITQRAGENYTRLFVFLWRRENYLTNNIFLACIKVSEVVLFRATIR